jgi:hypothetical protein
MPRPKNGYVNAAGEPVPGTHDPISRYMDQTALKIWAHKQGLAGLPLYPRAAIDIGSTVHGMAELDLKGRPDREIEAYCHECLAAPDHLRKAFSSFQQFRAWRQQCHVRAIAQEKPMVSETWQYGGTPDTIAMINGGLGLLDFKTSARPFPDHLVALAASCGRRTTRRTRCRAITSSACRRTAATLHIMRMRTSARSGTCSRSGSRPIGSRKAARSRRPRRPRGPRT